MLESLRMKLLLIPQRQMSQLTSFYAERKKIINFNVNEKKKQPGQNEIRHTPVRRKGIKANIIYNFFLGPLYDLVISRKMLLSLRGVLPTLSNFSVNAS